MDQQGENWERVPSYAEVMSCLYDFITDSSMKLFEKKPSSHFFEYQCFNFTLNDILLVIFLATSFTVIRFLMTDWCFKPLARKFKLAPENSKKIPESACRFLFYTCAWIYTFYLIILSGRYRFFQSPSTVWAGFSINESPPTGIYWMYMIQLGFCIHFVYATVFLDERQKDYAVMLFHHFLTVVLISVSYSVRCHNIGTLAFLTLDICDVLLEFTKLSMYFRIQGGKLVYRYELLANFTFVLFVVAWTVFRLYYYPLKLLYASTCAVRSLQLHIPCYTVMNALLWIIQVLNIYWSVFIGKLLVRVATGKASELQDTRGYDDDGGDDSPVKKLTTKSCRCSA